MKSCSSIQALKRTVPPGQWRTRFAHKDSSQTQASSSGSIAIAADRSSHPFIRSNCSTSCSSDFAVTPWRPHPSWSKMTSAWRHFRNVRQNSWARFRTPPSWSACTTQSNVMCRICSASPRRRSSSTANCASLSAVRTNRSFGSVEINRALRRRRGHSGWHSIATLAGAGAHPP